MQVESRNPARPDEVVGLAEATSLENLNRTVASAAAASVEWHQAGPAYRAGALQAAATSLEGAKEELAQLVTREVGKPIRESRAEVARAAAILRYYAQAPFLADGESFEPTRGDALLLARRFPVGVCALITPWNFPVAIPIWKAAPALAYGNAVLLKPSSASVATGLEVWRILNDCLPDGVLTLVIGGPDQASANLSRRRLMRSADGQPDVAAGCGTDLRFMRS